MKKLLFLILLFIFTHGNAIELQSPLISGNEKPLLHIINQDQSAYIYVENDRHQKILLYKSNYPYPSHSVFSIDQLKGTDILFINFECERKYTGCNRFFNWHTNKMSIVYSNMLDFNPKQKVVAYYIDKKNTVVIAPIFDACKKPLTYYLRIFPDSSFGIKTQFLKNGDLQLDYAEAQKGEDVLKIIQVNYQQLFDHCATG
ncbi:MAG: hypothetical protein JSR33_10910 [Proteobacteria bacterium]|nr:hypothetical protein [Pseudomonadota bacterium]